MNVLFISSGRTGQPGIVVKNQAESLKKAGIKLDYFLIKPGFYSYLISIFRLRYIFKNGNYDLAHAHYGLCGIVASLAGCKPIVCSLMGSDIYISFILRMIIRVFIRYSFSKTIVKTQQMKELIGISSVTIIPNGVNIEIFKPISTEVARKHIGYNGDKQLVVFIANINRVEKNFDLALKAVQVLDNVEFKYVYDIPNIEVSYFLNAADLLLLTSRWEGSVNVVKEAMACNCPVVSTDVGDVKSIIGAIKGCYITSFESEDVSSKIKAALKFSNRTNGRERILELGLDSETIASRITRVYKSVFDIVKKY